MWCVRAFVPANHLRVVVDGDVGPVAAFVGAKVAVWSAEPFIKTVLQRKVLGSVAEMPDITQTFTHHNKDSALNLGGRLKNSFVASWTEISNYLLNSSSNSLTH